MTNKASQPVRAVDTGHFPAQVIFPALHHVHGLVGAALALRLFHSDDNCLRGQCCNDLSAFTSLFHVFCSCQQISFPLCVSLALFRLVSCGKQSSLPSICFLLICLFRRKVSAPIFQSSFHFCRPLFAPLTTTSPFRSILSSILGSVFSSFTSTMLSFSCCFPFGRISSTTEIVVSSWRSEPIFYGDALAALVSFIVQNEFRVIIFVLRQTVLVSSRRLASISTWSSVST